MPRNAHFEVRGVHYREHVESIADKNPEYDLDAETFKKKHADGNPVYRYKFNITSVELVPEPDNPHGANAIKVMMNGLHVGYVPKESTGIVRQHISAGEVESITGKLTGGLAKYVQKQEDGTLKIRRFKESFSGSFNLKLKEKPQKSGGCLSVLFCMAIPPAAVIYVISRLICN